jgi:hypothetical protein
MNSTNDLLLLKNCLLSLSKISLDKDFYSNNISEILETLISKLESTNNGYVHGAIGNYYLFNKKVTYWFKYNIIHLAVEQTMNKLTTLMWKLKSK